MNDRTLTRVGVAGAGMVILPFMLAAFGLIAWGIHHRRATAAAHESKFHKESVKP
jgi:mercuric ion transport protein